jgi:hypothetical protein
MCRRPWRAEGESRHRRRTVGPALEYLGLKLVRRAQPIDELQSQITIFDGASDGCQIICDALQLAGVGGDRHVAAGCAAEGLAEEEVARGLVVEEELVQSCPCRAGEAIGALNQAVELVGEGAHEPQRYVDVDGAPIVVGIPRGGAFGDMIHGLVHGEEEEEDLPPLEEISPRGVDSEFDVGCNVDGKDGRGDGVGGLVLE